MKKYNHRINHMVHGSEKKNKKKEEEISIEKLLEGITDEDVAEYKRSQRNRKMDTKDRKSREKQQRSDFVNDVKNMLGNINTADESSKKDRSMNKSIEYRDRGRNDVVRNTNTTIKMISPRNVENVVQAQKISEPVLPTQPQSQVTNIDVAKRPEKPIVDVKDEVKPEHHEENTENMHLLNIMKTMLQRLGLKDIEYDYEDNQIIDTDTDKVYSLQLVDFESESEDFPLSISYLQKLNVLYFHDRVKTSSLFIRSNTDIYDDFYDNGNDLDYDVIMDLSNQILQKIIMASHPAAVISETEEKELLSSISAVNPNKFFYSKSSIDGEIYYELYYLQQDAIDNWNAALDVAISKGCVLGFLDSVEETIALRANEYDHSSDALNFMLSNDDLNDINSFLQYVMSDPDTKVCPNSSACGIKVFTKLDLDVMHTIMVYNLKTKYEKQNDADNGVKTSDRKVAEFLGEELPSKEEMEEAERDYTDMMKSVMEEKLKETAETSAEETIVKDKPDVKSNSVSNATTVVKKTSSNDLSNFELHTIK